MFKVRVPKILKTALGHWGLDLACGPYFGDLYTRHLILCFRTLQKCCLASYYVFKFIKNKLLSQTYNTHTYATCLYVT